MTGAAERRRAGSVASGVNARLWRSKRSPEHYDRRDLRPAEALLLARYAGQIAGRVLEIGCGGGRILGYLVALSREAHGIDVSEVMIAHCRSRYPRARVHYGDLRALAEAVDPPFDVILALDNILDVVSDAERRQALRAMRELLAPDGVLIFSAHNLDAPPAAGRRSAVQWLRLLATTPPSSLAVGLLRLRRRWRNRRRLRPLETGGEGYAILNDPESDWGVLHYYIARDEQQRQLEAAGWELVECLDAEGESVPAATASATPWLFYVARPGGD